MPLSQAFQLVEHRVALGHREGAHAQRRLRRFAGVGQDVLRDYQSFPSVGGSVPAIELSVGYVMELKPTAGTGLLRARRDEQAPVVELSVRHGDERMVPAPVVPAEHSCRHTLGQA